MRRWRSFVLVMLLLAQPVAARAADMPVDLELVLAVDVSRSMDYDELELQRRGYVAALTHPEVLGAIASGMLGRIAVTYVEWAGPTSQRVVAGWSLIDGPESAAAFAARLVPGAPATGFGTSIAALLPFAAGLFEGNGYAGERRTIDVSGDGPNNSGPPVVPARDAVVAQGITINGLPVLLKPSGGYSMFSIPDLDFYYEDCVIGGPGAFLISVERAADFGTAIRRKLVLEIAALRPLVLPVAEVKPARPVDCLIGEKLRQNRDWYSP